MKAWLHPIRLLPLALAAAVLTSCGSLLDSAFKIYRGPQPATEDLVEERVILRAFQGDVDGRPWDHYLDRLQFLDRGDSLHIDRIVIGTPELLRARLDSLGVKRGDTLIVSTKYKGITYNGGLETYIPNWGANKYYDGYPVALHTLTKVEKVSR
ncbi:MAG TPA: ferrous iron transport protein A [Longimicrobiaceae bacterium]|nr:ferrous iron transport protein A [Longimicrobiaceae bacterium]